MGARRRSGLESFKYHEHSASLIVAKYDGRSARALFAVLDRTRGAGPDGRRARAPSRGYGGGRGRGGSREGGYVKSLMCKVT